MNHRYRLPFHEALVHELQRRELESWQWFARDIETQEYRESQVTAILKQNARLKEGMVPDLEKALEQARQQLNESRPITLYRRIGALQPNASIVVHPDRLHIAIAGNLESLLNEQELIALFGHELAHAALWEEGSRELQIAEQMLAAWAQQTDAAVWQETERRFRLMTEIAGDRVGMKACQSPAAMIGCLVKIATNNAQCNADDYLHQAIEIFEREGDLNSQKGSQGWTHPEEYVRALSLHWWHERGSAAEEDVQRLVEGRSDLTRMTLLDQQRWTDWTEQLLRHILSSAWRATEASLTHARLFVGSLPEHGAIRASQSLEQLASQLQQAGSELRDYACFVLMDFATCDANLGDLAIAQSLHLGEQLGIDERLVELLRRDLKLRKRHLDGLSRKATELFAAAELELSAAAGPDNNNNNNNSADQIQPSSGEGETP